MILYIIRHGQAHEQSTTGYDHDRTLTDHGIDQAKAIAQYLALPEVQTPAAVLASPYIRTQQTATQIWNALNQSNQTDDRLAADQTVSGVLEIIADSAAKDSLAIVGHNPIVSRLVDVLIDGPSAPHQHAMATGQLIGLHINQTNPLGSAKILIQVRLGD